NAPDPGRSTPASSLSRIVLPAPLGAQSSAISPRRTVKSAASRSVAPPTRSVSARASIAGEGRTLTPDAAGSRLMPALDLAPVRQRRTVARVEVDHLRVAMEQEEADQLREVGIDPLARLVEQQQVADRVEELLDPLRDVLQAGAHVGLGELRAHELLQARVLEEDLARELGGEPLGVGILR